MNRPTIALSVLLAALGGTFLAVGSANSQTRTGVGRTHLVDVICPLEEWELYGCQEASGGSYACRAAGSGGGADLADEYPPEPRPSETRFSDARSADDRTSQPVSIKTAIEQAIELDAEFEYGVRSTIEGESTAATGDASTGENANITQRNSIQEDVAADIEPFVASSNPCDPLDDFAGYAIENNPYQPSSAAVSLREQPIEAGRDANEYDYTYDYDYTLFDVRWLDASEANPETSEASATGEETILDDATIDTNAIDTNAIDTPGNDDCRDDVRCGGYQYGPACEYEYRSTIADVDAPWQSETAGPAIRELAGIAGVLAASARATAEQLSREIGWQLDAIAHEARAAWMQAQEIAGDQTSFVKAVPSEPAAQAAPPAQPAKTPPAPEDWSRGWYEGEYSEDCTY